jgi:phosphate transport system protein
LVGCFNVSSEIEKVGDDAVKIARRVVRMKGTFPAELKLPLQQLGEHARHSFASAVRLYSEYEPALAAEIIASDKVIDDEYRGLKHRCEEMMKERPSDVEALMMAIETFRAVEHVADRAVAMAQRLRMIYEPREA